MPSTLKTILAVLATCILLVGCDNSSNQTTSNSDNASLQIIATTGQINAALQKLTAGTDANINLFCGPGVDPHSFSASTQDVQAMLDADLIIYNGFHLEAKLSEHLHGKFENKAWSMASAFPETARLNWEEDGKIDPEAPFDPHIWNHLPGWTKCVEGLAKKLAAADPDHADAYSKNAEAYVAEIIEAHIWAKEKLASLPANHRTIISAHDAFKYFANQYGMEADAVLGIGNDPEADIVEMRRVAKIVCDKKVPAIFMESITNPKVTQALKEACQDSNWDVKLIDQPLYSDDIGEKAPQNTFLGAFKSNVEIIFEALK